MRTSDNVRFVVARVLRAACIAQDWQSVLAAADELEQDLLSADAPADPSMGDRLAIGRQVRICGRTGIQNVDGKFGVVVGRHVDGTAIRVKLTDGRMLTVEPSNCDTGAQDLDDVLTIAQAGHLFRYPNGVVGYRPKAGYDDGVEFFASAGLALRAHRRALRDKAVGEAKAAEVSNAGA